MTLINLRTQLMEKKRYDAGKSRKKKASRVKSLISLETRLFNFFSVKFYRFTFIDFSRCACVKSFYCNLP